MSVFNYNGKGCDLITQCSNGCKALGQQDIDVLQEHCTHPLPYGRMSGEGTPEGFWSQSCDKCYKHMGYVKKDDGPFKRPVAVPWSSIKRKK